MSFTAIRDRLALDAVRRAPKGLFSDVVGWGARRTLPRPLRRPFYTAFARAVGADLEEVERPLDEYPSLGAFFARKLVDGARPLPLDPTALLSPCDGRVAAKGRIEDGTLLQVKGRRYPVRDLVADDALAGRYDGGDFITIYLSPRDYHRVHSPASGTLVGYDWLPGALYPVMPFFTDRVDGLLAQNERAVLHLDGGDGPSSIGRFEVVMVAAVGVGNLALTRPAIESRRFRSGRAPRRERFAGLPVAAGQELGAFELGSTVVLVFEPGRVALDDGLAVGEPVRFGQPLGRPLRGGDRRGPA